MQDLLQRALLRQRFMLVFEFTLFHNRDAATALLTVIDLSDQADALLPKVTIGDAKPKVMEVGVGVTFY